MKIQILFFIFLQISVLVFCGVEGWKRGRYHKSVRRDKETHKHRVKFPSGQSYAILSPETSSMSDCPGHATFVKLSPKNDKWKKEYEIVKMELERMLSISTTTVPSIFSFLNTNSPASSGFQSFQYLRIEKVFNSCLWYKYKYRKNQIYNEGKGVREKMLFHASSAPFAAANSGLDERYSNSLKKGALGAGLYFFDNPLQTHQSTKVRDDGSRVMMLCRVTLGRTNYTASMVAHAPVGFHSVGSKHDSYTEYSIYRGDQAYPDYVVTYIPK